MATPKIASTLLGLMLCILIFRLPLYAESSRATNAHVMEDNWVDLSMKQERQTLVSGNTKKFTCEAKGSPSPTITWRKDNEPIQESDNVTEELGSVNINGAIGNIESELFVPCVREADKFAIYSCVATAGVSSAIKYSQTATSSSQLGNFSGCLDNEIADRPRIAVRTTSLVQTIGKNVILLCRAKGFPQPATYWVGPNRKIIANSTKFRVLNKGSLVITNLSWRDMGEFKCMAENFASDEVTSTFVYPMRED